MDVRSVCLMGGTGFIGRALAERLCERGAQIRLITRRATKASPLLVLPTIDVRVADPHDEDALASLFAGVDAVVNLAGVLHERRGATFESVHVELPRKIANACRAAGVRRLVHMSALAASESGPSEYLRSKALGEKAVRQGAGDAVGVTIFRPSVVFGSQDRFLNLFARLVRVFPVIPLAAANARFQPVWVEDVAQAMADSLRDPSCAGRTFELCGPKSYTLLELVQLVARVQGKGRAVVALPDWAAAVQGAVLERLPGKLLTRDNLRSMSVENACSAPFPEAFGWRPASIEAIAPSYLAAGARGHYDGFRYRAGR